jgi:hypothetical protein
MKTRGPDICRDCHKFIHRQFTEKELGRTYNTREALLRHDAVLKFIHWVRKKRWRRQICGVFDRINRIDRIFTYTTTPPVQLPLPAIERLVSPLAGVPAPPVDIPAQRQMKYSPWVPFRGFELWDWRSIARRSSTIP